MNFIIIGEAVTKLSRQFKEENNTVKWSNIKGCRNILAHNYFGVDAKEVWEIIHRVLPFFSKEITTILQDKGANTLIIINNFII